MVVAFISLLLEATVCNFFFLFCFTFLFQNKFHWEEVLSKAAVTQTHLVIPSFGFWVSLTLPINQRGPQSGAGACASQSIHQHAPGVLLLLKWSLKLKCYKMSLWRNWRLRGLLIPALFALECHVHIRAVHKRFWCCHGSCAFF